VRTIAVDPIVSRPSALRRLAVVMACGCVFMSLVLSPALAHAKTAEALKTELDALKEQTKDVGNAFDDAYWKLDHADERVSAVNAKLKRTANELAAAKLRLDTRAALIYRRGAADPIEFILGAASFEDLVRRLDYMRIISAADADLVAGVKRLQAKRKAQRTELVKEQKSSAKALAQLRTRKDRLDARLKSKAAEFKRVKAELDAIRGGPNRPSGMAAYPGPNGMVFPVAGSYYYSDTWGAARSGGRTHKGTDIFAPKGTPVVAILSGTVSTSNHGLGGKAIWLSASNGWSFYYAHLDGWAVRSGHVKAGQIIGYVGNSGNAAGGVCHLHLQIEPRGSPVNPYPYLRAME
jgi:peptidoglycan LD-endopeptidase LytH